MYDQICWVVLGKPWFNGLGIKEHEADLFLLIFLSFLSFKLRMHFKPYFFASNCPVTPFGWSRPHQHVSPSVRNKVSSLSAYCSSEHWLQPIKSDGTDYFVCLSVITSVHYNNDLAEPLSLLEVRHCSGPPLSCVLFVAAIEKIVTLSIHTYV